MSETALGVYKRLFARQGDVSSNEELIASFFSPSCLTYKAAASDFRRIPGSPLAYWLGPSSFSAFERFSNVGSVAKPRQGMSTNDNVRFVRKWFEVSFKRIGFNCRNLEETVATRCKWFPYNKGGEFRKWFGNAELVVNWENDGEEIKRWLLNNPKDPHTTHWSRRIINTEFYCQPGLTWTFVSSSAFGIRYTDAGFLFDVGGSSLFPGRRSRVILSLLCTTVTWHFLKALNPTLNFQAGNIADVPWDANLPQECEMAAERCAETAISIARADWNNFETSWDFSDMPLLRPELRGATIETSWQNWRTQCQLAVSNMRELETENNRLFINAYGLQDELVSEVPEDQITLARADARKDVAAFVSYAVGCMLGRYSLDKAGLVLTNAGETLQQYFAIVGTPKEQLRFVPSEDGIIPVLDGEWFEDDIVARTREFLRATFGEITLRENIRFIEKSLGKDLRKYFVTDFYKDHLQTYKKRPIYWMLQSPRKSFNVLLYLHRYTRDTMNLVLNRYLREYQVKLHNRAAHLKQVQASDGSSVREKTEARKEEIKITKTLHECEEWERQTVLPLAQSRIELDLDDGVKVNYMKLGEALAPVPGLESKDDD